jgi:hypothetical protein
MNLIENIIAARRASVPLVAIATPDPAATIELVGRAAETLLKASESPFAQIVWDVVAGLQPRRDLGKEALELTRQTIAAMSAEGMDVTVGNPLAAAVAALKMPPRSVIVLHLVNRWLAADPAFVQALWNLRDEFKRDGRTAVLLGPEVTPPAELTGDVVVLDEPLPGPEQLATIIQDLHATAELKLDKPALPRAVEAVQGLPAFQAEQVVAMSLSKRGLDIDNLWERKRRQIELTPGLKVSRDPVRFADIGGVAVIKDYLGRILKGDHRPNAIVFIDEIEKFMAGATGAVGDSSGVSQDQLGSLLAYMQDHGAAGVILVGPAGSGKSVIAKAAGNESGIPTIQLDLGAMKGSLVGESESRMRAALKVITSVSNGRSLWIATSNNIAELPPELKRRFNLGTFFFDLPDAQEREAIWQLYSKAYDLIPAQWKKVAHEGWTGAEIRQACDIAQRLGCPLVDAAAFVVPVSRSAAEKLEQLRRGAEGRYLSASHKGVYSRSSPEPATTPRGRRMEVA